MFTAKVTIQRARGAEGAKGDGGETHRRASSLLTSWHNHGQTVGDPLVVDGDENVQVFVKVPERTSLLAENDNEWGARDRAVIGPDAIQVAILGRDAEDLYACACEAPSAYTMFGDLCDAVTPPVRCLDCLRPVPLYRFPTHYGDEHVELISWRSSQLAIERVWLGSGVGERLAARQLSRPDSALGRKALELRSAYEALAATPFYYALPACEEHDLATERARRCPGCGGAWLLPEGEAFDYRCDGCRLLSDIHADHRDHVREAR